MLVSDSEISEIRLVVEVDRSLKLLMDCDNSDIELALRLAAEAETAAD